MNENAMSMVVTIILLIILFAPPTAQIIYDMMIEYRKNKWIDETIAYDHSAYPNEYYTLTREVADKFYRFCCDGGGSLSALCQMCDFRPSD